MAPAKKGSANALPDQSGSTPQQGPAPRSSAVPENIWGPRGEPGWSPRPKQNTRSAGHAASAGATGRRARATPAPQKIPPKTVQPKPSPPSTDALLLAEEPRKMNREKVEEVERQTRGQARNANWHYWRRNRITASMAHQVSHSRFANGHSKAPPASYLSAITGEKRGVKTRAMAWGIDNEPKAARKYETLKSKALGRPVRAQECGLFIDPERDWLAASPDGIVVDAKTREHLLILEIKCPYKHKDRTVAEACREDRHFCLELQPQAKDGESQYRLKTNHNYYTQVQCQMAVVGLHKADFVVFTLKDIAIVPVTFDPLFWESTRAKMEIFYRDALLPFLKEKGNAAPLQHREE